MGQIISKLVCIYCQSGCQGSVVASLLAFHPPQPYYELNYIDSEDRYEILYSQEIEDALAGNIPLREIVSRAKIDVIKMSPKSSIPVIHVCGVPEDQKSAYTILFSHGNATDMGAMVLMYAIIANRLRVNVVGYDYSGYGPNLLHGGQPPMEKQTYKDIQAVYDWILQNKIVSKPGSELVLYGQSIGSGPTVYLASLASHPVAGVILHSPILSGLRVLTPSRLLCCCDIYPNIDRIKQINVPVLIIHGEEDVEVHIDHGKQLHEALSEAAKHPPWWVPRRGHNDIMHGNDREFMKRLAFFLHCTTIKNTRRKVAAASSGNSSSINQGLGSFSFTFSRSSTRTNSDNIDNTKIDTEGSDRVSGRMIGKLAEGLAEGVEEDLEDDEDQEEGVAMTNLSKQRPTRDVENHKYVVAVSGSNGSSI